MAQPSQQLPSWLTLSSTLVTDADGSISTSFATLRLPLTYFGPSIPLGTDGVWTYGGLTPPPSTMLPSTTEPPTSTATTVAITSSPLPSVVSSSTPASSTLTISSSQAASSSQASSETPTSTTSAVPLPTSGSHGISTAVLGAILGSILGVMLLLVLILTLCLLRRNTRRRRLSDPNTETDVEQTTSSFWNRQTFLSFLPSRRHSDRHMPIWTGWQVVEPDDFDPNGSNGTRNGSNGNVGHAGGDARTPGEGSPRGSGEEIDPFLVRRSIHSGTLGNEMTQTKTTETDTLVSVPPAAVTGVTSRSSPPRIGHIIPREVLLQQMAEEDEAGPPYADIRLVKPSPKEEYSPLTPPPPLDPDGLKGLGVRTPRATPDRSVGSRKHESMRSEKSGGSYDESQEHAELLVARRVRLGDHSRLPTIESQAESSSAPRSALGLSGLSNRLGRLSWFKRMSFTAGAGPSTAPTSDQPEDIYTRSPPRTPPRSRGHSRPGSQSRLLDDPDLEAGEPHASTSPGNDSGIDVGLLAAPPSARPISSVSARSASGTSSQSVYHDAQSRPPSSVVEFPVPVVSREAQERLTHAPPDGRVTLSAANVGVPLNPPPAYNPQSRTEGAPDPLDAPVPAPTSQFASSRPTFPPGLATLPAPHSWRASYVSEPDSSDRSSGGMAIDIEDDPPEAQEQWRDLSTDREGRRRTFGVPSIVHPPSGLVSQRPSVYTMHSQPRPRGSRSPTTRSPVHSTAASSGSQHTQAGSASSQPSTTSQLRSVSSAQSLVVSGYSDERREGSDELFPISPPLSAVMGSVSSTGGHTRPPSYQVPPPMPPVPEVNTPTSTRVLPPLPSGTVTTTGSSGTGTNSSVTTAATDPITGAVLHFPPVPWRREERSDRTDSWGRRDF